jgi:tetratricopeptide (TPR) repeat protein
MRLKTIIIIPFFIINTLPGKDFPPGSQDKHLLLRQVGDTSLAQLRREAADYIKSNQYDRAIPYLLQAFRLDTLSYEICNMLGECYYENGDLQNSIKFYKRITENIRTDNRQMALAFTRMGDVQKEAGLYRDAISSYNEALERMDIRNNYLLIAGICDNDLHDTKEAILYYEKYLDSMKDNINIMLEDHLEKVRLRVEYLKNR